MRVPKTDNLVTIPHASPGEGGRAYSLGLGTPEQPAMRALDAFNQAGNFYAPLIKGFEDASKATNQIARDMLTREAKQDAMNATTDITKKVVVPLLYENGGVLSLKGADAIGSTKLVAEELQAAQEEYIKNMSPAASEMFVEQFELQRHSILSSVSRHEGEERVKNGLEVNKRFANTYKSLALNNFGDDRLYNESCKQYMQGVQQTLKYAKVAPELWPVYMGNAKGDIEFGRAEKFMETGNFERALGIANNQELPEEKRADFHSRLRHKYFSTLLADAEKNPFELEAKLQEAGFDLFGGKGIAHSPLAGEAPETQQNKPSDAKSKDLRMLDLLTPEDGEKLRAKLTKSKANWLDKQTQAQANTLYLQVCDNYAGLPLQEQFELVKSALQVNPKAANPKAVNAKSGEAGSKAQAENSDPLLAFAPTPDRVRAYAWQRAKQEFETKIKQEKAADYLELQKMFFGFSQNTLGQPQNHSAAAISLEQIENNKTLSATGKKRARLELLGQGPKESANSNITLGELYAQIDTGSFNNAEDLIEFVEQKNLTLTQGGRALSYWQGYAVNPQERQEFKRSFDGLCLSFGLDAKQPQHVLLYGEVMKILTAKGQSLTEDGLKKQVAGLILNELTS